MKRTDNLLFCLLLSILFITPLAQGTEKGVAVWVVHVLVLLILLLFIGEMLQKKRLQFTPTPIDYPILAFVVLSLIAASFSQKPIISFGIVWQVLDYCIIYYVVVNKCKTKNQALFLLYCLMFIGTFLAIIGMIRYVGAGPPARKIFHELTSTYENSNHLAAYLAMVIPLTIAAIFLDMHIGQRIFVGYCLFMMAVAFVLTLSRGGWFSLLCALALMGLMGLKGCNRSNLAKRTIPIILLGGVGLIVIVGFGFKSVNYQLSSFFVQKRKKEIESFNSRTFYWKATLDLIRDYPVLGTGPGTFPYVYEKYLKKRIGDKYAHSEYLWVMSEWGIVSILLVIWMQVIIFKESIGWYLTAHRKSMRSLALGITGSLVAISIHSLADYNLHFMANMFVVVVLTGIVMGRNKRKKMGSNLT